MSPSETSPSGEPILFEVAWEVCRQVGGIYTVIGSKAPAMVQRWQERYCLIGPYDPQTSAVEFEERRPTGPTGLAVKALRAGGFEVHYGDWLVTGQPRAILLNPHSALAYLAEIKYQLEQRHGISCPHDEPLTDQALAFGFLVHRFFQALLAEGKARCPVIGHFHEWLGALAILPLRRDPLPVSTIFTTHATLLGRFLAAQDPWFYDHIPFVDWPGDARRFHIEPQVRLERAVARAAHLFTTVSEVTAFECEHLLGRKPDLLLPNGLNIERFVAMHEFQNLHRLYKEKIHQFVVAHFFPSYTFDLDTTLYFFNSGRYEYRNKGFDMTLEALARLNAKLKAARLPRTVVFFLITRRAHRGILADVLQRCAMLEEIRRNCQAIQEEFGRRLFEATAMGGTVEYDVLVAEHEKLRLRRLVHAWRAERLPSIVTHDLVDDNDEVLQQLRYLDLINRPEDPVKVVYHADFVSPTDLLFGMDYDHFVRGCHLGIFPSFYEPWGYTPLECVARGIPCVTSDVSGFGTYLMRALPQEARDGILFARRRHCSFDDAAEDLADGLLRFCRLGRRERIELRNKVESCADRFGWQVLGKHYAEAHRMVLERTAGGEIR